MQEVALPGTGGDPATFMRAATDFVNNRCMGTLCASIFIDPRTEKRHRRSFDATLCALRYRCITVNCPAQLGFGITSLPWGAYRGPEEEARGEEDLGFVHNTMLFDYPAKGVLRAPWRCVRLRLAASMISCCWFVGFSLTVEAGS